MGTQKIRETPHYFKHTNTRTAYAKFLSRFDRRGEKGKEAEPQLANAEEGGEEEVEEEKEEEVEVEDRYTPSSIDSQKRPTQKFFSRPDRRGR